MMNCSSPGRTGLVNVSRRGTVVSAYDGHKLVANLRRRVSLHHGSTGQTGQEEPNIRQPGRKEGLMPAEVPPERQEH